LKGRIARLVVLASLICIVPLEEASSQATQGLNSRARVNRSDPDRALEMWEANHAWTKELRWRPGPAFPYAPVPKSCRYEAALTRMRTIRTGRGLIVPQFEWIPCHTPNKVSPDGKSILFNVDGTLFSDLWVMSSDGSNARALTHLVRRMDPDIYYYDSRWIDEGHTVFVREAVGCGGEAAFLIAIDGTARTELSRTPGDCLAG
jgi:hypothetical protein